MDFSELDEVIALRAEIRSFLDEHLTPDVLERAGRNEAFHDWQFHRALAAGGWLGLELPTDYGGRGLGPLAASVLAEELNNAGAPTAGLTTTMMVANTLVHRGSAWLRQEFLPRILRGEVVVALGYSEPGAGSDLASIASRAEPDGECWRINAQKMFTTSANVATHVFLLTRSGPPGRGHSGMTLFLVPLASPGVEIQPIYTLSGERTNSTFYNDVVVPDELRVGGAGDAWSVLMVALSFERRARFVSESTKVLELLAERLEADATMAIDQRGWYERLLVDTAIDIEVSVVLDQATKWVYAQGEIPRVEGSMARLHSTLAYQRATSAAIDLLGPDGLVSSGPAGRGISADAYFRQSVVGTIYGGTSEVQRNIIAQSFLGMPRAYVTSNGRKG
jgi:alkylation response protein AidB-like acyl-CoA dehydrogenase